MAPAHRVIPLSVGSPPPVRCYGQPPAHHKFMHLAKSLSVSSSLYACPIPSAAIASKRQLCFYASLKFISLSR